MKCKSINDAEPKINVVWIRKLRGSAKLDFKRPQTVLGLGGRGSGKSSFLEVWGIKFPKIIDIFGSRDNEGLAWCRCPFYSKNEILFLTGDSVDVNGPWDSLKIRELKIADIKKYRVLTSVSAFYNTFDEEFRSLNELIYGRLYKRTSWREMWYLMVREASNFLYSRIKITKNQTIAKYDFIYLLRESRHTGYPCGVDTIRWTSLDKEIRDVADYLVIKSVGILGLPRDLRFLYRYVDPFGLMNPDPSVFVIVSKKGHIGVGRFDFPEWHKKEDEDLLKKLRLKPEYGEVPDYGDEMRNTVSDFEHNDIISKRLEGLSMRKIAKHISRSAHTVHAHIKEHRTQVKNHGYCDKCRRIKSSHATLIVT